ARFVHALSRIDGAEGPHSGEHNSFRGAPLAVRDALTRAALRDLEGRLDVERATVAWDTALAVPAWAAPPVWIHGDLQSGNLLLKEGRLCAVIDFGLMGVGDPAAELIVAWNLLSAETRPAFRAALEVDDATWARGRGWALSVSLIALPYYQTRNPVLAQQARRTIEQVLADARLS
ncbi:MAG TPA: phosphotransferase, partial [Polyangiaceae bacterium]|nr:phosphotransferase [Polyangiaceae bacterium]